MHSDLIGKIEKARYYAQEPERFAINGLKAPFRGGNNDHIFKLANEHWKCDCSAFHLHHICAHVMGMQRLMTVMLSEEARNGETTLMHSDLIGMVEKSRHYAHEPERVSINELEGQFHGSNNDHKLHCKDSTWHCDCTSFRLYNTCAHVMALQKILASMLPEETLSALGPFDTHDIAGQLS